MKHLLPINMKIKLILSEHTLFCVVISVVRFYFLKFICILLRLFFIFVFQDKNAHLIHRHLQAEYLVKILVLFQ